MFTRSASTFVLGILSVALLIISSIFTSFGIVSSFTALIGSFWGVWNLIAHFFKNITLDKKGRNFTVIGTVLSIVAFALGDYGMMIVFWLPSLIVGLISLRIVLRSLNKVTSSAIGPLQNKISDTEKQLQDDKQTPSQ